MEESVSIRPPRRKLFLRRRAKLWAQQKGLCYWCHCQTTLTKGPSRKGEKIPPDLATIDHLRSRLHPNRQEPACGQQRLVMACSACNNKRGAAELISLPIEEVRERSQQGHRSQVELQEMA